MSKLRLELDQLSVESFAAVEGNAGVPGTVRGHASSIFPIHSCPECVPSGANCTIALA